MLGLLNLFSGNALSRFSIFALGIMPYITASIILQLMAVVVPTLAQLQKEGESGYAKINQYTRYLTVVPRRRAGGRLLVPLPARRASSTANTGRLVLIVVTLTAGTTLLMWFGEQITKRGVGNGISLLIFASIIDRAPLAIRAWIDGGPDHQAVLPAARARRDRRRRLHPGGPAAHPDPVREAPGRATDDRRRVDLPADAREHGRRHPDHLRGRGDGVPADDRPVLPADAALDQPQLHADRLALPDDRGDPDHRLHVLLHGGPVQPGRPGRQPAQVRGLHPGHQTRARRRRSTSTACSRG